MLGPVPLFASHGRFAEADLPRRALRELRAMGIVGPEELAEEEIAR